MIYKKFPLIVGKAEYHDIAAEGLAKSIADFINENIVTIMKIFLHGSAVDEKWLDQEIPHRNDDGQGNEDDFEDFPHKGHALVKGSDFGDEFLGRLRWIFRVHGF